LGLSGCTGAFPSVEMKTGRNRPIPPEYSAMYAAIPTEPYPVPAVDLHQINPVYWRQIVPNETGEGPGTVVVDSGNKFLYWTQPDGSAVRYGIGVGREGFGWDGVANIPRKAEWPVWTPPEEMIGRQPELEEYRNGMPPGIANPLGARAMYLYQGKQDTLYRLHGTNEAYSIGNNVSSGCVRLVNQDVIDLYNRVPVGTRVVVRPAPAAAVAVAAY
jgi:lipoprotein-anchoring transpeptidase ErfK/SrfK